MKASHIYSYSEVSLRIVAILSKRLLPETGIQHPLLACSARQGLFFYAYIIQKRLLVFQCLRPFLIINTAAPIIAKAITIAITDRNNGLVSSDGVEDGVGVS